MQPPVFTKASRQGLLGGTTLSKHWRWAGAVALLLGGFMLGLYLAMPLRVTYWKDVLWRNPDSMPKLDAAWRLDGLGRRDVLYQALEAPDRLTRHVAVVYLGNHEQPWEASVLLASVPRNDIAATLDLIRCLDRFSEYEELLAGLDHESRYAENVKVRRAAQEVFVSLLAVGSRWRHPAVLAGIDFLRPGSQLTAGLPLHERPVPAYERLAVQVPGTRQWVSGPADLAGRVRITSPQAALSYVRLFTSPATVRASSRPWWVEVVPRKAVDLPYLFGRKSYADWLKQGDEGQYRRFGILRDSEWVSFGLPQPTAKRCAGRYNVRRVLFRVPDHSPASTSTAYLVSETVSRDGHLQRKVLRQISVPGIKLFVPERVSSTLTLGRPPTRGLRPSEQPR